MNTIITIILIILILSFIAYILKASLKIIISIALISIILTCFFGWDLPADTKNINTAEATEQIKNKLEDPETQNILTKAYYKVGDIFEESKDKIVYIVDVLTDQN